MKQLKLHWNALLILCLIGLLLCGYPYVLAGNINKQAPLKAVSPVATSAPILDKAKTVVKHPRVAIIIDDVGLIQDLPEEFYKIPAALTWSVLPHCPYTRVCAEAGKSHGFQVLLHLPMDPYRGTKEPGNGFIIKSWLEDRITRQFEEDLAQVPEAVGLNNHMGSTNQEDEFLTAVLMSEVKKKNLFYIDSLTGPYSVARKYARLYQVPFNQRDVFIDHYETTQSKMEALHSLIRIALKTGEAIGIGHVRPGTATAIATMIPEFEKAGVKIVHISELVKVQPLPGATPEVDKP
jgi:uncharacterized protein